MGEEEDHTGQEEDIPNLEEDFSGQEEDEMEGFAFEQFDEENFAADNFSASFDNSSDEEYMEENDNVEKDDEEWEGRKSLTTGPWKSKNKAIIWSPTPPENPRYVPAPILKPGITAFAESRISTPETAFGLMMTDEIIQLILKYTNLQGSRGKGVWKEITEVELRAYFGLIILSGIFKAPHEPTASLWDKETGRTIFPATMSRQIFEKINRNLRFDDPLTKSARMERDKLGPISRLWSLWSYRFPLLFKPERDLCLGAQLVPYRGNCPFRQYMPNKPGKYGLKIWTLCDVKTLYALKTHVDTGKSSDVREDNGGMRLTLELTDGMKGYNITTDKHIASVGLADALWKRKMTLVGTIKKNGAELPPEILSIKERETMSSMFAFHRNKALISYVPKRSKNVVILSTKHREPEKEKKGKKRPQALLDYYSCKGAVDNHEKYASTYSGRRTSHSWAQALFYYIIDVSAHNAMILYLQMHPTWNQDASIRKRYFLEELGKSLVAPAIATRPVLPRDPTVASMVQSIQEQAEIVVELGKKRRQCRQCIDKRIKRRCLNKCSKCHEPICKDHIIYMCLSCSEK